MGNIFKRKPETTTAATEPVRPIYGMSKTVLSETNFIPIPTVIQGDKSMSILSHIGGFFKKIFDKSLPIAVALEPVVDTLLPGIAVLYNSTVAMVANAEMTATAAGQQEGTGTQKLAAVVSALEPLAVDFFKTRGIVADKAVIEKWVSAVVASLNAIPAPAAAVVAPKQ